MKGLICLIATIVCIGTIVLDAQNEAGALDLKTARAVVELDGTASIDGPWTLRGTPGAAIEERYDEHGRCSSVSGDFEGNESSIWIIPIFDAQQNAGGRFVAERKSGEQYPPEDTSLWTFESNTYDTFETKPRLVSLRFSNLD